MLWNLELKRGLCVSRLRNQVLRSPLKGFSLEIYLDFQTQLSAHLQAGHQSSTFQWKTSLPKRRIQSRTQFFNHWIKILINRFFQKLLPDSPSFDFATHIFPLQNPGCLRTRSQSKIFSLWQAAALVICWFFPGTGILTLPRPRKVLPFLIHLDIHIQFSPLKQTWCFPSQPRKQTFHLGPTV